MNVTTRGQAASAAKSTVIPAPHLVPQTPSRSRPNGNNINDFLIDFCRTFDVELPINEVLSPEKRTHTLAHGILKKLKPLYFRSRDILDNAIVDLRAQRPAVENLPDRLQILDDRLSKAVSISVLTPHTVRIRPYLPVSIRDPAHVPLEAPPSPTLSVKHAPSQLQQAPIVVAGNEAKSATTSFATTMTTSFTSNATSNAKTSQDTAATSFSTSQGALEPSRMMPDQRVPGPAIAPWVDGAADVPGNLSEDDENPVFDVAEHHRVRDIPKHGLAPVDLPASLQSLPFSLLVEAYRVMRLCKLSPTDLERQWTSDKTFQSLWKLKDKYAKGQRFLKGFDTDYKDHTLCAKLQWTKVHNNGPLFDLEMRAPQKDDSNAFQRKFGSDRILTVDLPDLNHPPEILKGQRTIVDRVLELLNREQKFLGRTWVNFHAKRKKGPEDDPDEASNYQVSFIALNGNGLPDIRFAEFINFAIPLCENLHQMACKAYSRLDLAASRTKSVYIFDAECITFIRDIMSDGQPDDDTFNDPNIHFPRRPLSLELLEMTDGCGEVSLEVMQELQRVFQLTYLPSVFQARICHSKGLWYYMPGSPPGKWIKIRDSQRKLKRLDLHDDEWRTLNINGYSQPAKSSILYSGFIPILTNRGVPAEAILDIARRQVNMEGEEFLNALENIPELHRWIFVQKDMMGTRRTKGGIPELAGFPVATDERIAIMLDSGFEPIKSAYLKKQILDAAEHVFNLKAKRFKIRLTKSTSLLGVPDMTGTLKPGEVHIVLSQPLRDPVTGEIWSSLHGLEVLIARNPSLRDADIQKIRVVYKPELAHLRDVVVFSVRGPRPLASKLSGGDYDGDTFWICWEPSLVQPFKSAPAPWKLRPVEDFGIIKDKTTLGEILGCQGTNAPLPSDTAVRKWINKYTAARMTESLLPKVTLFHSRLVYADNNVSSEKADMLVDLHDLLVDADKQGYCYDQRAYDLWRYKHNIPRGGLSKPAHWKFTRKNGDSEAAETPKPGECVDDLYFNTVEPEVKSIMLRARAATKDAVFLDTDLTAAYDDVIRSDNPIIQEELKRLISALQSLQEEWTKSVSRYMHDVNRDRSEWAAIAVRCREKFLSIMPTKKNAPSDTVVEWTRKRQRPSFWEELRLSVLAKRLKNDGSLLFTIAGAELCWLKAQGLPQSRTIRLDTYVGMKPQKRLNWAEWAGEEDEDGADSEDEATFYEGASVFDSSELGMLLDATATTPPPNRKRKTSPRRETVGNVKRQSVSSSSPSSARNKPGRQPTTPVTNGRFVKKEGTGTKSAKSRVPRRDDDMGWLPGLSQGNSSKASETPVWLQRRD